MVSWTWKNSQRFLGKLAGSTKKKPIVITLKDIFLSFFKKLKFSG